MSLRDDVLAIIGNWYGLGCRAGIADSVADDIVALVEAHVAKVTTITCDRCGRDCTPSGDCYGCEVDRVLARRQMDTTGIRELFGEVISAVIAADRDNDPKVLNGTLVSGWYHRLDALTKGRVEGGHAEGE